LSKNDVPYFVIITSPGHNINIDKSVTQLDGIYIAEPDSAAQKGLIHTCYDVTTGSVIQANSLYDLCRTKLTVNGGLVAKQVKFERSNDTLKDAVTGDTPVTNKAAEVINYTPELFIAPSPLLSPSDQSCSSLIECKYDAISTLPPLL
jgi:hypothetical protein